MTGELQIVDLSHPLSTATPPFPGDPAVSIEVLDAIVENQSDGLKHFNCSQIATCVHCGTHMDAPFHFFANGKTIDALPLETCIGPAVILSHSAWKPRAPILIEHLAAKQNLIASTKRVILNSGWSQHWGQEDYFEDHPVITGPTAEWLVALGVVLVAVDFPSVDRTPYPAHHALLGRGVVIVENLTNIDAIESELFELIAVPLAISGRDGSPIRAIGRYAKSR